MWIRIRAVIIEDEPLAAQYLAELLDDTCQVEVVGTATESEAAMRLCAELRPDAVFVDINLPGKDGVSLATQTNHASAAATPGLYYRKREPRDRRLPASGGGLSFEALGSGASHGGGQSPADISAAL
jgi:chemotaxis response regulator CheB